ncbi:NAD-dependent epimerase/dehydratase family protein [Microbacterium sp. zg.Y909]|uniref:NAD-dependent epimerase/dehydratase family protein n=1 Tax=Microbacterium sp. zg.Y909 TaxID=2969413 RepID=UPI00214C9999|nr:NAD-dependent epimerase/dehydratase family protein [Microbacterium sp. zg.Y909]MCR2824651.1 NAD-dependent epimerase/dehydratase family protein [Microbacterium sp. zg.Y909]
MPSETHVIVGAGPVGSAVADRLAGAGHRVRVITRSGRGPEHPNVARMAVDASDRTALADAAQGAAVLYNCANPGSYEAWQREWPPLAASILHAAETSGAVLVTLGNLYGYGPVDEPMTRRMPLRPSDHKGALRARMWEEARAAHAAGRIRATEARASDYVGPTVPRGSSILAMYAQSTLAGKPAWVFSDPDQPHAWTAIEDVAETLIALGADERAWGSPWLVPSSPPASVREVLTEMGQVVGAGRPRLRRVPRAALRAGGAVVPLLRELTGVLYQFDRPFLVDAEETTAELGIEATEWSDLLERTARAWQVRAVTRS